MSGLFQIGSETEATKQYSLLLTTDYEPPEPPVDPPVDPPEGFGIHSLSANHAGIGDTITITGATEAQINSRLQAITVTFPDVAGPATADDWNGSFDVTITYNDKGNTGTRPGDLVGTNDTTLDETDARTGNGDFMYADGTSNNLVTTRIITVTDSMLEELVNMKR